RGRTKHCGLTTPAGLAPESGGGDNTATLASSSTRTSWLSQTEFERHGAVGRVLLCVIGGGNRCRPLPALSPSSCGDHLNCAFEAGRPGLGLLGSLDRFDVLALVGIAEIAPALPRRRCRSQGLREISGRFDLALSSIELEFHIERLAALQSSGFAV